MILNPLNPNIKEQILLSSPDTFLVISRKFTLGHHILNCHDLRGCISIDITRRNLMLNTVRA